MLGAYGRGWSRGSQVLRSVKGPVVLRVTKSVVLSNDFVLAGLCGPVCRTSSGCQATGLLLVSRGPWFSAYSQLGREWQRSTAFQSIGIRRVNDSGCSLRSSSHSLSLRPSL